MGSRARRANRVNRQAARQLAEAAVAYVAAQRALDAHTATAVHGGAPGQDEAARAAWWRQNRALYQAACQAYDRLGALADSWRLTAGPAGG